MPENLEPSDIHEEDVRNPGVEFEPSQADLRVVYAFLISLALGIALVSVVLWGMYRYLVAKEGQGYVPAPVVFSRPPDVPEPKLEPDPVVDYNHLHLFETQWLSTYGWVDQKSGVARIPIDHAMDLLVERGLPTTSPASNPNPATGPLPGAARQQNVGRE